MSPSLLDQYMCCLAFSCTLEADRCLSCRYSKYWSQSWLGMTICGPFTNKLSSLHNIIFKVPVSPCCLIVMPSLAQPALLGEFTLLLNQMLASSDFELLYLGLIEGNNPLLESSFISLYCNWLESIVISKQLPIGLF